MDCQSVNNIIGILSLVVIVLVFLVLYKRL